MMREQSPKEYSCAAIRSTKHCGDGRSSSCDLNDDLLIAILSKSPPRSLLRFMSVSKSWRSLISSTFSLRPLGPVSGLLYRTGSRSNPWNEKKGYIDLSDACNSNCRKAREPWSCNSNCMEVIESWSGTFLGAPNDRLSKVQYCNGLFLLYSESIFPMRYHICNPAINQCFALPEPPLHPNLKRFMSISTLAFDPSLSPHYKVVRFSSDIPCSESTIHVDIFSSKERKWIDPKVLPETLSLFKLHYSDSVFMNGALHFIIPPNNTLYSFDVEELSGRTIKLPKSPSTFDIHYFGKCQDHLFYINSAYDHAEMRIWMLQNLETGEWLLKHTILSEDTEKLPVAVITHPHDGLPPRRLTFHPNLEVIFMDFQGKILSYHFGSKMSDNERWEEVCTFGIDRYVNLLVPYSRCLSFLNPPLLLS
ncbi:hypothetical protein AAC387_Pa02g4534 [Persea americana]